MHTSQKGRGAGKREQTRDLGPWPRATKGKGRGARGGGGERNTATGRRGRARACEVMYGGSLAASVQTTCRPHRPLERTKKPGSNVLSRCGVQPGKPQRLLSQSVCRGPVTNRRGNGRLSTGQSSMVRPASLSTLVAFHWWRGCVASLPGLRCGSILRSVLVSVGECRYGGRKVVLLYVPRGAYNIYIYMGVCVCVASMFELSPPCSIFWLAS